MRESGEGKWEGGGWGGVGGQWLKKRRYGGKGKGEGGEEDEGTRV